MPKSTLKGLAGCLLIMTSGGNCSTPGLRNQDQAIGALLDEASRVAQSESDLDLRSKILGKVLLYRVKAGQEFNLKVIEDLRSPYYGLLAISEVAIAMAEMGHRDKGLALLNSSAALFSAELDDPRLSNGRAHAAMGYARCGDIERAWALLDECHDEPDRIMIATEFTRDLSSKDLAQRLFDVASKAQIKEVEGFLISVLRMQVEKGALALALQVAAQLKRPSNVAKAARVIAACGIARDYPKDALVAAELCHDPVDRAQIYIMIAQELETRPNTALGIEVLDRASSEYPKIGNTSDQARILCALITAWAGVGREKEVRENGEKFDRLAKVLDADSPWVEWKPIAMIGALCRLNRLEEAERRLKELDASQQDRAKRHAADSLSRSSAFMEALKWSSSLRELGRRAAAHLDIARRSNLKSERGLALKAAQQCKEALISQGPDTSSPGSGAIEEQEDPRSEVAGLLAGLDRPDCALEILHMVEKEESTWAALPIARNIGLALELRNSDPTEFRWIRIEKNPSIRASALLGVIEAKLAH